MAQQTAVEWLINELKMEFGYGKDLGRSDQRIFDEINQQAKAMEKEQMVDATVQYLIKHRGMHSEQSILTAVELSEQYYNETYNK
jgi:hypothetical protein